jgi:uncharacterized hydantoinase/oxoprolinase family protein
MNRVLGLDIGGANIKAAHSSGEAWSEPFALWKAPHELGARLTAMIAAKPARAFDELRLTMTAELCDCFATKREGVNAVLDAVTTMAGNRPVFTWSTAGRFVSPGEARAEPLKVAASNWHVLGTYVARSLGERWALAPRDPRTPATPSSQSTPSSTSTPPASDALGGLTPPARLALNVLIDIGSTTTDIVRLRGGGIEPGGLTDMDRLASGELVYTGAWRTPLMVYGPSVSVRGRAVRVMSEYFAGMADAHLLLGHIAEDAACTDTADGRSATRAHAAARVLRMVGADLDTLMIEDAIEIARHFALRQRTAISMALRDVVGHEPVTRIIASGQGAFLVKHVAPGADIVELETTIGREASIAACAWAILRV